METHLKILNSLPKIDTSFLYNENFKQALSLLNQKIDVLRPNIELMHSILNSMNNTVVSHEKLINSVSLMTQKMVAHYDWLAQNDRLINAVNKATSSMALLQNHVTRIFTKINADPIFNKIISRPSYSYKEIEPLLENLVESEENKSIAGTTDEAFLLLVYKMENGTLAQEDILRFSESFPLDLKKLIENNKEISSIKIEIFSLNLPYLEKKKIYELFLIVATFFLLKSPEKFIEFSKAIWVAVRDFINSPDGNAAVVLFGIFIGILGIYIGYLGLKK